MKIALIGQQDFGKATLEAFLARGDQVADSDACESRSRTSAGAAASRRPS